MSFNTIKRNILGLVTNAFSLALIFSNLFIYEIQRPVQANENEYDFENYVNDNYLNLTKIFAFSNVLWQILLWEPDFPLAKRRLGFKSPLKKGNLQLG